MKIIKRFALHIIKSFFMKRDLEKFPAIARPHVINMLMEAGKEPNSMKKSELFMSTLKRLDEVILTEAKKQKEQIAERFQMEAKSLQAKVSAPTITFPTPRIDFITLEEKARAKRAINEKKARDLPHI